MRLLHVTPYYAPAYAFGGVVRSVQGMAESLVRAGHQVTVLSTDALDGGSRYTGPGDEQRGGVRVVRASNLIPRGSLNLSTPRGMRLLAQELLADADVVHCHEFRTVENLIVTPLAASLNKPLVLSPHGTLTLETGRSAVKAAWDALFSARMARRFDHVIALTASEAEEARRFWQRLGVTHTRFHEVPNGVDPAQFAALDGREAFRQQYGLGDGPVCLFLGRLHPRKGPHILARAFQSVPLPDARLVIAGPDEGALALIKPFQDDRVVVTGYLGPAERLRALAAADVFALPAVGEGLSMALLEALAAGLPAVISPGCNLPEAVLQGAALEIAPEPDALAPALGALLADGSLRQQMGMAARRLVHERYTWESVAARLEAVYVAARRV